MKKLEYKVNDYCSFEFDPNREYEGTEFWSLSKRKKGKFGKGGQVTITNDNEKEVFIELLKDIIADYEVENIESDVPF